MPIGNPRLEDFDSYLKRNGIPIDGVSDNNNGVDPYPQGVTIQFRVEATQEQIDWSNAALAAFDWRPRQVLDRNTLATNINTLTQAEKDALLNHLMALQIQSDKNAVLDAMAVTGIEFPVDQVVP